MSNATLTIVPSVGRKVWFYEHAAQEQPFDATVIAVLDAPDVATVTSPCRLSVTHGEDGHFYTMQHVVASAEPIDEPHFRWMPYQAAQAKKPDSADLEMRISVLERAIREFLLPKQPPADDAFVAPGSSLFSDPSQTKPFETGTTTDGIAALMSGAASGQLGEVGDVRVPGADDFVANFTAPQSEAKTFPGDLSEDQKAAVDEQSRDTESGSGPL